MLHQIKNKYFKHYGKLTFIIVFLSLSIGCSFIAQKIMGVKQPKIRSDKEIKRFINKNIFYGGMHFTQLNNYYEYFENKKSAMILLDSNANDSFKVFIQPLQALYFDTLGNLTSVLINCYATPRKYNLNWNTDNRLEAFPPKTHTDTYKKIKIDEILKLTNIDLSKFNFNSRKNRVIVFWNIFLNRQTQIFLKEIQSNFLKSKEPLEILYINNDNSLYNN